MHELAITQSLLRIALDKAAEAGAARIQRINLRIGELSGYLPEAVETNFRMLSPGTRAEGARLSLEWLPVSCECRQCGRQYRAQGHDLQCPGAGRPSSGSSGAGRCTSRAWRWRSEFKS